MKKTSKIDAAYIAGFFDGEGSIHSFTPHKYPRVRIVIGQKDLNVLKWIKQVLGFGKVYTVHRTTTISRFTIHHREEIARFIKTILPYTKVKRKQLELGLKLTALVGEGHGSTLPKNNLLKRIKIIKEIGRLNHA